MNKLYMLKKSAAVFDSRFFYRQISIFAYTQRIIKGIGRLKKVEQRGAHHDHHHR